MAIQIQLRQGTTTEHNTFKGAVGEVTVDTTKKTLVVHDGVTAGGTALAKVSEVISLVPQATETVAGKAKIAMLAETLAGTNTTKIVTPYNLAQTVFGMNQTNKLKTVVSGTTYTHTNDKPSFLSISMNGTNGTWANVTHNGNQLLVTNISGRYAVSILVAKGDTYYISGVGIVCMEYS